MNTTAASSSLRPAPHASGPSLLRWLGRYMRKRRTFLTGMGIAAALGVATLLCMAAATTDVFVTLPRWARWTALTVTAVSLLVLAVMGLRRAMAVRRRGAMDEIEAMLPARGQLMRTALEEAAVPA